MESTDSGDVVVAAVEGGTERKGGKGGKYEGQEGGCIHRRLHRRTGVVGEARDGGMMGGFASGDGCRRGGRNLEENLVGLGEEGMYH